MTKENRFNDDNREQENNNPDRPPIEPGQPERPAPFDPFSTPQLPDGGTNVRDTTESLFDTAISQTTKTTTSPPTPTTKSNDTEYHTDKNSLIGFIRRFASYQTTFEYMLQRDEGKFNHIVMKDSELKTRIKNRDGEYTVDHKKKIDGNETLTSNHYNSFSEAISAMIEAIDWGSLPPGQNKAEIWEYTGFQSSYKDFEEYLTGKTNRECGDHVLRNTAAEYEIVIENFSDKRLHSKGENTICVITIQTVETKNNDKEILFRDRFNGQKEAFEFTLQNLDEGLSKEIALQQAPTGDESSIPTIDELQTTE